MAVSQKIITNNQQPHNGYGYVGMAGNKGLSAAETLLGSGVCAVDADGTFLSRPTRNQPAGSGNMILGPALPGTGADRQVGPFGQTISVIDGRWNTRFDETNYYHGSGTINS